MRPQHLRGGGFKGGGEDNSFDFNSLRSGHFFTKICYCMQHNLLNTHTKFQGSICKNVDVKNEKPILIAKFTKCVWSGAVVREWTRNERKFICP